MATSRAARTSGGARLAREEALALRVSKHYLDRRAPRGRWRQVVSDLCGLQAQSMSAARMAIWTRVDDFSSEAFDEALLEKKVLVKVYGMRGTVHVLAARDWDLYFAGLKHIRRGDTLRGRGLSAESVDKALRGAGEVLATGPVTMKELEAQLPTKVRKVLIASGAYPWHALIKDLLESVSVCFGPPRGQEVTYVLSERWLARKPCRLSAAKAEHDLAVRYLRAFAPAKPSDFAHWSGLARPAAQDIFGHLRDLAEVDVEGDRSWMLADDLERLRSLRVRRPRSVRLLPNFDTYLLGHEDKALFLDAAHHKRVFPGAARVAQTILIDGRVAGTWTAKTARRELVVEVSPFQKQPSALHDAVEAEAAKLAAFLVADHAKVSWSKS